ncbi:hypothetical protein JCM5350_007839 [Sporobolomyces pararoseus]
MILFEPVLHTYAPKGSDQSNPLPALIAVVLESIAEVFALCLVGFFLARRGIINKDAKRILNKLNTSLFNPSLLSSKIMFSLTPKTLVELWVVPVSFVIITCFSAAVAYILGRLFRLKKGQRNFAIACSMFQNSNSLPIALLQSLLSEKLPLSWGPHDTKTAQLGRGLSYLVLFSTLGIIVRWSIGVKLVSSAEEGVELTGDADERDPDMRRMEEAEQEGERRRREDHDGREEDDEESEENEDLESSTTLRPDSSEEDSSSNGLKPKRSILKDTSPAAKHQRNESSSSTPAKFVLLNETDPDPSIASSTPSTTRPGQSESANGREPPLRKKKARVFQSFPNTPAESLNGGSRASSVYGAQGYEDDGDASAFTKFGRGFNKRVWRPLKRFGRGLKDFMTVPLWAALLSLVVACIPPLQHTLDKIEPLKASLRSAGACSVPITLITLGAYFYSPSAPTTTSMINTPEDSPEARVIHKSFSTQLLDRLRSPFASPSPSSSNSVSERRASSGANRTVIVSVLSRMIIVPLVLIPAFGYWAYKTVNRADDPVFVVVACLLIGSPTAITLAQITSASSNAAAFEKLISRTLFVSYAFLTGPTTIALVLAALYIDRLQNPKE